MFGTLYFFEIRSPLEYSKCPASLDLSFPSSDEYEDDSPEEDFYALIFGDTDKLLDIEIESEFTYFFSLR